MVETVVSVVLEVGKWLAAPIGRRFMYLYNYRNNLDNLEEEVRKLKDAKEEVKGNVVAAEKNVEKIRCSVQEWQKNVDSIIVQAEQLIAEKENDRCFKGFCPNLIIRYKHGKEAFKIKEDNISSLLQQQKDFDKVSNPTILEHVWLKPDKNYTVMESRNSILNDIVNALTDANVNMIGIYGMGGIGKTTMVKEVARQVKKFFDEVVFVEVTVTPDVKKIQTEIADQLHLQFMNETEKINKLYERLKKKEEKDGEKKEKEKEGKILIILDNLWDDNFDLKSIGIPDQSDDRGCKLLLTARHQHVLKNMGDPKLLQIGNLSEEESWRLFKDMAGDFIETREFKSVAENICNICKGLPIAIVTIAKALRHKNKPSQWNVALRELKRSSPNNFTGEIKEAYATIELSYKYLKGEELQKTFLLCSLMRHRGFILDLVKYVVGLDIFQDIYSIEEAREKVHDLICDLKGSFLLFNGHTNGSFSMNDFVREVALSIANRDDHVFSVRNEITWQWPHQDRLKICKKIFIFDCTIRELCNGLDCPELESFFMNTKIGDSHVEIPENFFTKMKKLKVLDLTRMQFFSLQSSLQFLVNLQTLCLDYCKFEDVAIIGMLNELKILSLRGSNVENLPKEIGQLTKLRLLDLSNCEELNFITPNVLPSLVKLEELYMNGCTALWEVEASNVERSNASLGELKYLSHLTTLELDIKYEEIFPKGLFTTKKLERYKISIGDGSSTFGGQLIRGDNMQHMFIKSFSFDEPWLSTRMLKLKLTSIIWSEELQGFRNVEFLCIDKLNQGIKNVLYELDKEGFSKLKHLHVHNNPNILCLVDSIKCVPDDAVPAFPLLESLILFNLIELQKICYGQHIVRSFCNLKTIEVQSCTKLENIFSFSNPRSLPQLQRINVSDCRNMKEIFVVEREDDVNINEVICQLRFLTLKNLPRIAKFYLEVKTPSTSQSSQESTTDLQYSDINLEHELDTPSPLFNEKVIFSKLEALELYDLNSKMIWDSQLPIMSDCYRNLTRLIIVNLGKLKYVFPSSIVKNFEQLQHLEIWDCNELKEIIAKEEGEEAPPTFMFPRVEFFELKYLPKLTTFYPGIHTSEWPKLKKLEVNYCDKLHIFTSEYKVVFPNLEALRLQDLNSQMIWDSQLPPMSDCYGNLTRLIIEDIGKLKYVFPSSMVKNFKQLRHLEIWGCKELKEIIAKEEGAEAPPTFIFPLVEFVRLKYLPKLTTFYPGIHTSEWPKLKKLEVSNCDKLHVFTLEYKVIFPNLEALELKDLNSQMIWDSQLPLMSDCYRNLTRLIINNLGKLKYVFPSSLVRNFEQLQYLQIWDCKELKEIIAKEEGAEAPPTFIFPRVEFLKLESLQELTVFYPGIHTSEWPKLKKLEVSNCDKLHMFTSEYKVIFPNLEGLELKGLNSQMIWDSQLPTMSSSYQSLTRLIIVNFGKLKYVFPSSLVKNFEQLQHLEISNCKELKEIVAKGVEAPPTFIFPRVEFLKLINLPELTTFYPGIHTSEWPKLKKLEVKYCRKLHIFTSEYKVVFPNLEDLNLQAINSQMIWDSQLPPMSDCYRNLTRLIIEDIGKLKYVFPFSIVKNFEHLQHLEIMYCKELKEIVAKEEGVEVPPTFIFPRVEFLKLENLPKLTTFYPGIHTSEWPKLKKLKVSSCDKLQMSTSQCKIVSPNLEALDLHGTHDLELIWGHLIWNKSSCYQNLTRLIMTKCAKLKYVFPSSVIKSFAQLQHLEISSCKELKEIVTKEEGAEAIATFTFPHVAFLKLNNLPELTSLCLGLHTSEWPMLKVLEMYKCDKLQLVTSDFKFNPNREELLLRVDNMMTWQCLFPKHFFFKGTIEIKGDKSTNFLLEILQRSFHFEKLILRESLYKELFSCGEKDKHTGTLMQIKCLKLSSLSKLKCMWKQESKLDFVLQDLRVLEVYVCNILFSLLPSHASFANLTVLRVSWCWGPINLFVPSTAKSLVQLMEMEIKYCRMITEIISNEDHEDLRVQDEIVFSKLKLLSLENLKSLTCFCFGNYNFEFPVLEELIVNECPNMKTFSEAVVSAPSLGKVKLKQDDNEGCWKGDLNTTIQHLHKKVVKSNLENLRLSGKDIMPVWQDPLPEHQFCQVKVLEVIRDESAHIPIEILQRFKNLEKLVLKVSSYQEIFSCRKDEKHIGMLTQIKELELLGLFDLKYMWKQDSHLDSILQNLEMLDVKFCHDLISLAPSSATFENLTTLYVWQCDGLINLVSYSTAKSLVRLEEMAVVQCEMIIELVSNEGDKKKDEIVFENLKYLTLTDLESLTSFCSGNYTFKFSTLEELVVEECPKMKTFSEGVLSTPSLQKVMQRWDDREGYWEGDLNTTIQHGHKNLISEKD